MRRSLWIRILTATWGLWLGVALSEPMMLHSCAVTGARAASMASMPGMAGMDMGSAHGGTHGGTHVVATGDASHPPAPAHGSTNCFGACCCAPTVLAPSATVAGLSARVAMVFADVASSPCLGAPITAAQYSQPFANGPPATHSI